MGWGASAEIQQNMKARMVLVVVSQRFSKKCSRIRTQLCEKFSGWEEKRSASYSV